jgi:uridylate kinase
LIKYKRILLKISGEALTGEAKNSIYDLKTLKTLALAIKKLMSLKVDVAIVVGAGNIWRGKMGEEMGMNRAIADYMGMLGTIINSIAIQEILEKNGVPTRVQTALNVQEVAEPYILRRALRHFEKGRVVIFGGGTGNPFFSTDTAAALRAAEIGADVILMAKHGVNGIFSSDPKKDPKAKMFKNLNYLEALNLKLRVMDNTALSLCMDNNLDIVVFNMDDVNNIVKIVQGEKIGTHITRGVKK